MESVKTRYRYLNKPVERIEGKQLAMGEDVYMEDLYLKEYYVVSVLHSPYPNASVESYDDSGARSLEGVIAVYNWEDAQNQCTYGYTYSPYEHRLMMREAHYEGDAVAMVVADTEKTARKALKLIKIKWKVNEPLMDMREARGNEIVVHKEQLDKIVRHQDGKEIDTARSYLPEKNQIVGFKEDYGDVERAKALCDCMVTAHCHTSQQMHAMLETHRCYAYMDERNMLVLKGPMQVLSGIQDTASLMLGIDKRKIRLEKMQVGGGFGGKNVFTPYLFAAFAAYKTGLPVVYIMTREESMAMTGTRHEYALDVTLGADRDGRIRYLESRGLMNGGAYCEFSDEVMGTGIHNTYPLFPRVDGMSIEHLAVHTNKVMGCAFRGFGATQNTFALNCACRRLAAALDMDEAELYKRNVARAGDSHPVINGYREDDPAVIGSAKIIECIEKACSMIDWEHKRNRTVPEGKIVRGVGIGVGAHASGVPRDDRASVNVTLNPDGSFSIFTGHCDIGTGSNTAMIQIVAETLDVPMDIVHIKAADSVFTPFDNGTYASSNVYRACGAAKKAADIMVEKLLSVAKEYLGMLEGEDLFFAKEWFVDSRGKQRMSLAELAAKAISYWEGKAQIVACGTFPDHFAPSPYAVSCLEVEIDRETGFYRVIKIATAVDAGQIINSNNARVQIHGGITQSLGMAMFEEVKYSGMTNKIITKDYQTYKMPSQMDMPELEVVFVDSYEPSGPFGAKSLGEIATCSPAPALCDAIWNATGVQMDELPVTPERLYFALQKKNGEKAVSQS